MIYEKKTKINLNKFVLGAAAAVLLLLVLGPASSAAQEVTFKGNVVYLDKVDLSLEEKFETALRQFKQEQAKKLDAYFTGYIYTSRHSVRFGQKEGGEPYRIYTAEGRIKVRRTRNQSYSMTTDTDKKGSSPAGVIFLHRAADGQIVDTTQVDLEETFTIEDYPLYWFGEADQKESFDFLQQEFEKAETSTQEEFVFLISSHVHPDAEKFLHRVALGDYPSKSREQAIFWLGSNKYDKSLDYLKDIYKKEDRSKIREKVVFSFYLSRPQTLLDFGYIGQADLAAARYTDGHIP